MNNLLKTYVTNGIHSAFSVKRKCRGTAKKESRNLEDCSEMNSMDGQALMKKYTACTIYQEQGERRSRAVN